MEWKYQQQAGSGENRQEGIFKDERKVEKPSACVSRAHGLVAGKPGVRLGGAAHDGRLVCLEQLGNQGAETELLVQRLLKAPERQNEL